MFVIFFFIYTQTLNVTMWYVRDCDDFHIFDSAIIRKLYYFAVKTIFLTSYHCLTLFVHAFFYMSIPFHISIF